MKSMAIFSGAKIGEQTWKPGHKVSSVAIAGLSSIDFRQAEMEEGITKVTAVSIFGATRVIVPKGLQVNLSGFSLFGGKRAKLSQVKDAIAGKELHISAVNIFGLFQVIE